MILHPSQIYLLLKFFITLLCYELTNIDYEKKNESLTTEFLKDEKNTIHMTNNLEDLNVKDIYEKELILINSTNSILINNDLLNKFNDNSTEFSNVAKIGTSSKVYYEVNYNDMDFSSKEKTEYSPCIINDTNHTASHQQSFGIGFASGTINAGVKFTSIFFDKFSNLGFDLSKSHEHLISCDVNPGDTLQIQIETKIFKFMNIKQRKFEIKKKNKLFKKYYKISFDKFNTIDPFYYRPQRSIYATCITDPDFLHCET